MYQGKQHKAETFDGGTNGTYQYGNASSGTNPYGYIDHVVQEGETLGDLEKKYGVSKEDIIKANSSDGGQWGKYDRSKEWLYKGETIKIPIATKQQYDIELIKRWVEEQSQIKPEVAENQTPVQRGNVINQNGLFGQVIAQSERRPGEDGNDILFGENSPFNTEEAILEACPACANELEKTDDQLFERMFTQSRRFLGVGEMETNNDAMIERFRESTGGFYENEILNRNVRAHPSMQRFIHEIQRTFSNAMIESKGNTNDMFMELYDGQGGNPRFNTFGDKFFGGLTFAINDMQMYDIELVSIETTHDGWYEAELMVIMYDHFGLDETDPAEYAYDVFESWFVLQHNRGYQPFITRVPISITCSGHYKPEMFKNMRPLNLDNMRHHE
jgi:hypothetical protein